MNNKTNIVANLQYNLLAQQNNQLKKTIDDIQSEIQYYENNSGFQQTYSEQLSWYNYYLFILYYLMVLYLIFALLFAKTTYSLYYRCFLVLGFLLYPWLGLCFKEWFLDSFYYYFAIFNAQPYQKDGRVHPNAKSAVLPVL
jgi:hypothetical protein